MWGRLCWRAASISVPSSPQTPSPPLPAPGSIFLESGPAPRRSGPPPQPGHVEQRSEGTVPFPRHIAHGRFTANPPWPNDTVPRPLHSGHVLIVAPGAAPLPPQVGQTSGIGRVIGIFPPSAATLNGIETVTSITSSASSSSRVPRRPKMDENRSPSPPKDPRSDRSKSNPAPPAPGGAPPEPGRDPAPPYPANAP